jgi:hypothetical protein
MATDLRVTPNGLRKLLLKTQGSISVQTKERFEQAMAQAKKQPQQLASQPESSSRKARPSRATRPVVTAPLKPTTKTRPIPLDLYKMAGQLLADGRQQQATLLSLIARLSEHMPIEEVTRALEKLLPRASLG